MIKIAKQYKILLNIGVPVCSYLLSNMMSKYPDWIIKEKEALFIKLGLIAKLKLHIT
jgi:hypothetical protein